MQPSCEPVTPPHARGCSEVRDMIVGKNGRLPAPSRRWIRPDFLLKGVSAGAPFRTRGEMNWGDCLRYGDSRSTSRVAVGVIVAIIYTVNF